MRLRLTRRALGDIDRIGDYLRARNPPAARRVRKAIEAGLALILNYPEAGPVQRYGVRRLTLPVFSYLIFYKVDRTSGEIVVLTIRHGARKPVA